MAHRRKPQTPGKLLRLLYIRTLRNSSAPVLSKAITTRRCARKEDRSKPEPDRSKPGRRRATKQGHTSPRVYFGRVSFGLPYLPSVRINRYSQFSRIFNVPEEDSSGVRIYSTFPIHTWTNKSGHFPPHPPSNVEKMLCKKFSTLKNFPIFFRKNAKQKINIVWGVWGVFAKCPDLLVHA